MILMRVQVDDEYAVSGAQITGLAQVSDSQGNVGINAEAFAPVVAGMMVTAGEVDRDTVVHRFGCRDNRAPRRQTHRLEHLALDESKGNGASIGNSSARAT